MKPDIYKYHDYRAYLRDWLEYRRKTEKGYSSRKLAKAASLTAGFLSLVLSGERALSANGLAKLMPSLELSRSERSFLEAMHLLGTSDSHDVRLEALNRMAGFAKYAETHSQESETYQYLTHWYHVAIRELATDPAFKAEPEWIQSRLRVRVALGEIKAALDFLIKHGYLAVRPDGSVHPPEKHISGLGGVYRISLAQFHRQMFRLAEDSLDRARDTERYIMGQTFSIGKSQYAEAKAVVDEAMKKIQGLADASVTDAKDNVYHFELALFPLTKGGKES